MVLLDSEALTVEGEKETYGRKALLSGFHDEVETGSSSGDPSTTTLLASTSAIAPDRSAPPDHHYQRHNRPKFTTRKRRRDLGSGQLFPKSRSPGGESLRMIPAPSSQFRGSIERGEETPPMTGSGAQRRAEYFRSGASVKNKEEEKVVERRNRQGGTTSGRERERERGSDFEVDLNVVPATDGRLRLSFPPGDMRPTPMRR
ncbi:hypothetical protein BHM03_00040720 [Ensete ventricosum]|nr:hypothetical protein BHM03_00040720 [Ensete ventricosum]